MNKKFTEVFEKFGYKRKLHIYFYLLKKELSVIEKNVNELAEKINNNEDLK